MSTSIYARRFTPSSSVQKFGKRAKTRFAPSEEQVEIAAGCIVGMMKRCRGVYYTECSDHALANELLAGGKIHRARRLGRDRREIATTVVAGLRKLQRDGKLHRVTDSTGRCMFVMKDWHEGRRHQDKYRNISKCR